MEEKRKKLYSSLLSVRILSVKSSAPLQKQYGGQSCFWNDNELLTRSRRWMWRREMNEATEAEIKPFRRTCSHLFAALSDPSPEAEHKETRGWSRGCTSTRPNRKCCLTSLNRNAFDMPVFRKDCLDKLPLHVGIADLLKTIENQTSIFSRGLEMFHF